MVVKVPTTTNNRRVFLFANLKMQWFLVAHSTQIYAYKTSLSKKIPVANDHN